MSDLDAQTPDTSSQVALAVRNLMPGLRRQSFVALAVSIAAAVASGIASLMILSSEMDGTDRFELILLAVGAGILVIVLSYRHMRKKQEALVMPVLAESVGLRYDKAAQTFLNALPARLLPKGVKKGEDHVSGTLGAHTIQMAEVNVETGGKNSRTLFKGIIAQFPNRTTMPAFFVALADKTRPGIFFGGDLSTDGLHHLRDVQSSGRTYGVWTSWSQMQEPPALAAVVEVLTGIERIVGNGVELYAATSNGVEMHLALSHKRNLFRVGGLFPSESDLFADVRAAMQDLSVPLTVAKALISAEETAMAQG
jgi:hypothetical protein